MEVGEKVKVGDRVWMVEGMKMMKEMEGEKWGRVKGIVVESGEGVEFEEGVVVME